MPEQQGDPPQDDPTFTQLRDSIAFQAADPGPDDIPLEQSPLYRSMMENKRRLDASLAGTEDDGAGFFENAKDQVLGAVFGLPQGAVDFFNEETNFWNSAIEWVAQNASHAFPGGRDVAKAFAVPSEPLQIPQFFGEPETFAGGLSQGVTKFALGMITLGKFGLGARGLKGTKQFLNFSVRGAIIDATAFDPTEARMGDFLEEHGPEFMQPVAAFLASDEDDPEIIGRIKQAMEGFVVGGTFDLFIRGLRVSRVLARMEAAGTGRSLKQLDLAKKLKTEITALEKIGARQRGIRQTAKGDYEITRTPTGFGVGKKGGPPPGIRFRTREQAEDVLAMLEMDDADRALPSGKLGPDQLKELRSRIKALKELPDDEFAAEAGDIRINVKYSDSPEDAIAAIIAISDEIGAKSFQSNVTSKQLAGRLLREYGGEELVERLGRVFKTEITPQVIVATNIYMDSLALRVAQLARITDRNPHNALAAQRMMDSSNLLHSVVGTVADATSQMGRNFQALQVRRGVSKRVMEAIARGGKIAAGDVRVVARRVMMAENAPGQMRQLRAMSERGQVARDKLVAFSVNALLSNPITHAVNITSNLAVAFHRPAELIWAGKMSGNEALTNEGWDIMAGHFMYLGDVWRATAKSFKAGQARLDPRYATDERLIGQHFTGKVSKYFETPSRFLFAEDEFFKVLQYRSFIRAKSLRLSREAGLNPKKNGVEIADRIEKDLNDAFDPETGRGLDGAALEYSRISTFTNDLGDKTIGRSMQNFFRDHPIMRAALAPFLRTPVNLLKYTGQRTPILSRFGRQWQIDIEAGGEQAAIARAKWQMGAMVYTTAGFMNYMGWITGGGPRNENLRADWLRTHQPYSFRIGNKWVSYRRSDPIMTPFALVSDAWDAMGELDPQSVDDVATVLMAAVAETISNRTYFASLSSAMDAVTAGDPNKMRRFIRETTLSRVIPWSGLFRNISATVDPVYREAQGILDEILIRTPWGSKLVEPKFNIYGEEILRAPGATQAATDPPGGKGWLYSMIHVVNPARVQDVIQDPVSDELLGFRRGLGMPDQFYKGNRNIDLRDRGRYESEKYPNQSPYAVMAAMVRGGTGDLKRMMGGVTLREALVKMATSDVYRAQSPGTELFPGGKRWVLLNNITTKYWKVAAKLVRGDFERLDNDITEQETLLKESFVPQDLEFLRAR